MTIHIKNPRKHLMLTCIKIASCNLVKVPYFIIKFISTNLSRRNEISPKSNNHPHCDI